MFVVALAAGRKAGDKSPSRIIRFGFFLLALGVAILIPIVPHAHSGWWLVVPLLIAGSGLGLLVSQLNNYTLAPIEEERVSEAAGVNSAAGSFGLSFGLAVAGGVMLAALSVGFTQMTENSDVIPAAQQQQIVAYLQQIDDSVDGPSGVVVGNLAVRDTANAAGWSIQANLQIGSAQFGDRAYAYTSVPGTLVGSAWIRTANLSRAYAGTPLATYTISEPVDVYIGVDTRVGVPSWMSGWANTGLSLVNNESPAKTFTLYMKSFPTGTVTLGPLNNGGVSMYTVIVK
jgi:MFS family permease